MRHRATITCPACDATRLHIEEIHLDVQRFSAYSTVAAVAVTTYPLGPHRAYAVMECITCQCQTAISCLLRSDQESGIDVECQWFVSGVTRNRHVAHVDCPRCKSGAVRVVGIDAMANREVHWDLSDRLVVGTVPYDGQHVSVYFECTECSMGGTVFVIRMAPTLDGVTITTELEKKR